MDSSAKTSYFISMEKKSYFKDKLVFLLFSLFSSILFTTIFGLFYSDIIKHPAWYRGLILSAVMVLILVLIPVRLPKRNTNCGIVRLPENFILTSGTITIRGILTFFIFNLPTWLYFSFCEGTGKYTLYGSSALYSSLIILLDYVILKYHSKKYYEEEIFKRLDFDSKLFRLDKEYEFRFWWIRTISTLFLAIPVLFTWQSALYSLKKYGELNSHVIWGMIVATAGSIGILLIVAQKLAKMNKEILDEVLKLKRDEN